MSSSSSTEIVIDLVTRTRWPRNYQLVVPSQATIEEIGRELALLARRRSRWLWWWPTMRRNWEYAIVFASRKVSERSSHANEGTADVPTLPDLPSGPAFG